MRPFSALLVLGFFRILEAVDFRREEFDIGEAGDALNRGRAGSTFSGKFDFVAGLAAHQRLADGGFVRNNPEVRGAVPGSQNVESLFLAVRTAEGHGGSDGNLAGVGIFKIGSTGQPQITFAFGPPPLEDALLFLGGFETEILSEIAFFFGDGDVAKILGDLSANEVFKLFLAFSEAGPGDRQGLGLAGAVAADKALHLGMEFDDPGEERAFAQFFEDRAHDEAAGEVAHFVGFGALDEITDKLTIIEEKVLQSGAAFFVELIELESAEDGTEQIGTEDVFEAGTAFLAEPDEDFGGSGTLADPACQSGGEFDFVPFFLGHAGDIDHEAGGSFFGQAEENPQPVVTEGDGKLFDRPALFRRGEGGEEFRQAALFADENVGHSRGIFGGLERVVAGVNFVPGEEEFQRLGGLKLASFVGGFFDLRGQRAEFFHFVGKIPQSLRDLIEGGHLIFEVAGTAEFFQQAAAGRDRFVEQDDRVGLLNRKLKVAVGFEFFLRGIPPFFIGGSGEDGRAEHVGDLCEGRGASMIAKDVADEPDRVFLGAGCDSGRVGGDPGEDVLVGNRTQGLCGVVGLHRVFFAGIKIDQDLTGDERPLGHLSESPALMQAKCARCEQGNGFGGLRGEFSGFDGLLDFFSHCVCAFSDEIRRSARAKSSCGTERIMFY